MADDLSEQVQALAQALQDKAYRVATAESCTGGGIASAFTDLAGSSAWFECGFVTYSNKAKERMLGVCAHTLARHGAVSEETVRAMVQGAVAHSDANLAVAVSGVAGPSGGTLAKPVGTVWIAWGDAKQQQAQCFYFSGDRQAVRQQSVLAAVRGLLSWLSAKHEAN